jgi:hypothetical protein
MHPALAPGMGKCRTCGEGQAHCLLRYLAALLCTCDPSRCNPSPAPSPPLPPSPLPPPPLPTPVGAKHVLFMVVDDMRPMMRRAYNFSLAVTPHMDQLASEGLTFTRAYCNYAICSPSRNSFMSGRRPDTTRVWEFKDSFRQGGGLGWTSLPEWYKRHGYLTLGSGKLFHVSSPKLCPPPPPPRSRRCSTQLRLRWKRDSHPPRPTKTTLGCRATTGPGVGVPSGRTSPMPRPGSCRSVSRPRATAATMTPSSTASRCSTRTRRCCRIRRSGTAASPTCTWRRMRQRAQPPGTLASLSSWAAASTNHMYVQNPDFVSQPTQCDFDLGHALSV